MKPQKILIISNYNILIDSIIDYLIDSGHSVDIICEDPSKNWLNQYSYNLHIIDKQEIDFKNYNLFINFEKTIKINSAANVPEIDFLILSILNNSLDIACIVRNKNHYKVITQNTIAIDKNDFRKMFFGIKEIFIDGLIILIRNDHKKIKTNTIIDDNKIFTNLICAAGQIEQLKLYYKELDKNNENIFHINDLLHYSDSKHFCKKTIKQLRISSQNLELIFICILMLLNARQPVIYKYNFKSKNILLTKYISVSSSDTYEILVNKLNHSIYNLINLHNIPIGFVSPILTEIMLTIDPIDEEESSKYSLIVSYNLKRKTLEIQYPNSLYFFNNFDIYFEYFYKQISSWKNNNYSIISILYNDLQELAKCFRHVQAFKPNIINTTIHELFEQSVIKNPNSIALVYKDKKITYSEVNAMANRLANYIIKSFDVKPDTIIVIFLDRNELMLVSILAILKSGAAYLPIDINNPDERIKYILTDSKANIILTNNIYQNRLQTLCMGISYTSYVLLVDNCKIENEINKQSQDNPLTSVTSRNLAYVIYTSGTTGKPKGVLIEHRGVSNLVINQGIEFEVANSQPNKPRNYLFYSNYVFDAHVSEVFTAILNGHTLHILDNISRTDIKLLENYIKDNNIQVATLPPAILSSDLELHLETLIIAGDTVDISILNYYSNKGIDVINAYGPTEATVCISLNHFKNGDLNTNIGKPLPNIMAYVLDKNKNLLPAGVIGELYVNSVGLARGYLNSPEITEENFINNKFSNIENQQIGNRLYKTGDLVRYLPDGSLEYIGRNDNQVKINGYRIELGEIEKALFACPDIRQAVVTVDYYQDNKYLLGYYVSNIRLEEPKIKDFLALRLPEYMIPNKIIQIESIPLTNSGKLDKKQLPKINFSDLSNYVSANNPQEKLICDIFSDVLGVPKVGITDDFFRLGGNSIRAIRLTSKLQTYFDINFGDVLNLRTPQKLAQNARIGKNVLIEKLEKIKFLYQNNQENSTLSNKMLLEKKNEYYKQIKNLQFDPTIKKSIQFVLLTGATGYLGCNILYNLLLKTSYQTYLLVRAPSDEAAYKRLINKFHFYFNINLENYKKRIIVYASDIEQPNLNLNNIKYQELIRNVSSIIHTAALAKHYGNYSLFYQANVQATINLLELAKLTKTEDFHYISSSAPLSEGEILSNTSYIIDEGDTADIVTKHRNPYAKTKYEGELIVAEYRKQGIKANIYRLGNLAFMTENCKLQENIQDNAFYHWVKGLLSIGYVAKEISLVDITPVDMAADAIVRLFDKKQLENNTFHIFNPNKFNISNATQENQKILKEISIEEFINKIISYVKNDKYGIIERFILRQGWLDDLSGYKKTDVKVLQDKTQNILNNLGFKWYPISNSVFENYISGIEYKKMGNHIKIFDDLSRVTRLLPTPIYWLDTNATLLGGNENFFKTLGITPDYIGTTGYDVYPVDIAAHIVQHDKRVMQTGISSAQEELTKDINTGQPRYFKAFKTPVYDVNGKVIGLVGTLIEITAEKEAERLEIENQAHIIRAEEDERFNKIVQQVVHDIRSPLATMQMVIPHCEIHPENARITLNQSANRIQDIANQLLHRFKPQDDKNKHITIEVKRMPDLVSTSILEIISEKRFEYSHLSVDFVSHITPSGYFAFANIDPQAFRRMLSNLINNSVDALQDKIGIITVYMDVVDNKIKIIVEDTGCGIPEHVRTKLLNNISVSEGKEDGHGIGFAQIIDTLNDNQGQLLNIESELNIGTKVSIAFPKIQTPDWVSNQIELKDDDIVVILDDDPSIHGAWDTRFEKISPNIERKHFEKGVDAIEYIDRLTITEKKRLLILADYELLKQEIDGLDVITRTKVDRSILVTSHYNNSNIRDKAHKSNTKILPKPLAAAVPIVISNKSKKKQIKNATQIFKSAYNLKKVDLVFIDDDKFLVDNFINFVLSDKKVDIYHSGTEFLKSAQSYDINTKFLIDLQFKGEEISGIDIAIKLHDLGFNKLYLFSGWDLKNDSSVPYYVNIIAKTDIDAVASLV
ncbi:MAG: amino acid adenylation domain-containing protein [Neisseriaceae bacterium]